MKHNNFKFLIKEELVKRFEDVVLDEVRLHNNAVNKSNVELDICKSKIHDLERLVASLESKNEERYANVLDRFLNEKRSLENSFSDQRSFIKKNAQDLDKTIDFTKKNMLECIKKEEFQSFKKEATEIFIKNSKYLNEVDQSIRSDFDDCMKAVYSRVEIEKKSLIDYVDQLEVRLNRVEKSLSEFKIDSIGVLKELQVYKKSVFILEKKVENLYLLIDRLKMRD